MVGEHHIDAKSLHSCQDVSRIDRIDADAQVVTVSVVYHTATDNPPAAKYAHCTDPAGESRCAPCNVPYGLDKNPQGERRRFAGKNRKETMVKRRDNELALLSAVAKSFGECVRPQFP